jgi:hypothetical protein
VIWRRRHQQSIQDSRFLLKTGQAILFLFFCLWCPRDQPIDRFPIDLSKSKKPPPPELARAAWGSRAHRIGSSGSRRPGNSTSPFDWLHHQELGVNTHAKLATGRCGYFQQDKNSRQFTTRQLCPLPWSHSAKILARYLARGSIHPFGLHPKGYPHFLLSRRLPTDRINKSQRRRKTPSV